MNESPTPMEVTAPPLPALVRLDELHRSPMPELLRLSQEMGLRLGADRTRRQLVADLLRRYIGAGVPVEAVGMLEMVSEVAGMLRWPHFNFRAGPDDIYVTPGTIKQYGLRAGNELHVTVRPPREREKVIAVDRVLMIEGIPAEQWEEPVHFDKLTPLFPEERLILENEVTKSISARAVDLIAPLGLGQRGLIVAPPRVGKTILMKEIALAIRVTSPKARVILLLVDERPEEVTDLRRTVDADIYSSTFDESPARHIQVAELVSERARRLVEQKQDVIILLDSITRLARGYNSMQTGKGRTMSGGVEAKALLKPKRFFGAARNVEEGGSLTILATALIETQSRMDDVIFEEFKGTGNMELHLDRSLTEKRIYPAIHILQSGTRREELLYHPQELEAVHRLRKQLAELPAIEAMEILLDHIKATKTNAELLLGGIRT